MGTSFTAGTRFLILLTLLLTVPGGSLRQQPDILLTPICLIQGSGFVTPYNAQAVNTRGVVIADLDSTWVRGFYIQHANCDGLQTTSDGIFVYLGEKLDVVQVGDFVDVSGIAQEYYGLTEVVSTRWSNCDPCPKSSAASYLVY